MQNFRQLVIAIWTRWKIVMQNLHCNDVQETMEPSCINYNVVIVGLIQTST